jgi:hypothetical protein
MHVPPEALLRQLGEVSEGLLYPSETDAPFTPFAWETMRDFTPEKLLLATRHSLSTRVETCDVADFFEPLTREEEWFDSLERQTAKRFANLYDALQRLLSDIQVYRLGDASDMDVYIIGKTDDGYYAGVSTRIVET